MSDKNISKEYVTKLISDLVAEGESKEELDLWLDIFNTMAPEQQQKLVGNLEAELEELKKIQ